MTPHQARLRRLARRLNTSGVLSFHEREWERRMWRLAWQQENHIFYPLHFRGMWKAVTGRKLRITRHGKRQAGRYFYRWTLGADGFPDWKWIDDESPRIGDTHK